MAAPLPKQASPPNNVVSDSRFAIRSDSERDKDLASASKKAWTVTVTAVSAFLSVAAGVVAGVLAQAVNPSPLIEGGGVALIVSGTLWIIRYLMRAVDKSVALADARVEALQSDLTAARERIQQLEEEISRLRSNRP